MSDLLAGLTAERLEELAKWHQEVADMMAEHEYSVDQYKAKATAAALRAVAGAERALDAGDELLVVASSFPVGLFRSQLNFDWMGIDCPTLLSALGAVGAEEKHDG